CGGGHGGGAGGGVGHGLGRGAGGLGPGPGPGLGGLGGLPLQCWRQFKLVKVQRKTQILGWVKALAHLKLHLISARSQRRRHRARRSRPLPLLWPSTRPAPVHN
ncbi:uncharacterized protein J3R85_001145, partial [Psidium guajava]